MNRVNAVLEQCRKPSGWLGRLNLKRMNSGHSKLTDWGLAHVSVGKQFTILDIGCGGGRAVQKLAALASEKFSGWTTPMTVSPSHVKRIAMRWQRGAWRFGSPRLVSGARKAEDREGCAGRGIPNKQSALRGIKTRILP